jgi:hypothetical protein
MRCPIKPEHKMVEVAEGLFQCPHCGYGPSDRGHHPFWALSNVEVEEFTVDAVCVRLDDRLDCYVMSGVSWAIDERGAKIPRSFSEDGSAILSTREELEGAALPVVIRAKGKWDFPPAKPKLQEGMFPTPLGLKEISLTSARRGRS